MMGRLLNHVSSETDIRLISIAGGTKNNVISSECKAEILVAKEDADKVKADVYKRQMSILCIIGKVTERSRPESI